MKILEAINGVLDGKILLTNVRKYSVIVYSVCAVHVILFTFFLITGVLPLTIYNVFSVILYLSMTFFIRRENYLACFVLTYCEICVHSIFAMIVLGGNDGFVFYNLALIPVSYYISYTTSTFKKKMFYPVLLMIGNMLLTAACTGLTFLKLRTFTYALDAKALIFINCFNIIIAFVFLTIFSILFVVEIRSSQYSMKMQNLKLNYYAQYDPLTSLLNRRSMEVRMTEILDKMKEQGLEYSVAISDIDDFKQVNDSFGHECGDKALIHIAGTLRGLLPDTDYLCRWGGEEFLFMIAGTPQECLRKTEIMRSAIEKIDFYYKKHRVKLTMTFGLQYHQPKINIERTISMADDKLYQGKQRGKNCVIS